MNSNGRRMLSWISALLLCCSVFIVSSETAVQAKSSVASTTKTSVKAEATALNAVVKKAPQGRFFTVRNPNSSTLLFLYGKPGTSYFMKEISPYATHRYYAPGKVTKWIAKLELEPEYQAAGKGTLRY